MGGAVAGLGWGVPFNEYFGTRARIDDWNVGVAVLTRAVISTGAFVGLAALARVGTSFGVFAGVGSWDVDRVGDLDVGVAAPSVGDGEAGSSLLRDFSPLPVCGGRCEKPAAPPATPCITRDGPVEGFFGSWDVGIAGDGPWPPEELGAGSQAAASFFLSAISFSPSNKADATAFCFSSVPENATWL